jgi:hypothetical protein
MSFIQLGLTERKVAEGSMNFDLALQYANASTTQQDGSSTLPSASPVALILVLVGAGLFVTIAVLRTKSDRTSGKFSNRKN